MLVRVAGDNIMMSPPFIMTPSEIDEVSYTTIPQYMIPITLRRLKFEEHAK